jgi:hypothetical protein
MLKGSACGSLAVGFQGIADESISAFFVVVLSATPRQLSMARVFG